MRGWEGCPRCRGMGEYIAAGDLHISSGVVPCDLRPDEVAKRMGARSPQSTAVTRMHARPKEFDMPHWAASAVAQYRAELKLPDYVTGRMIYARLVMSGRALPAAIESQVRSLVAECNRAGIGPPDRS